MVRKWATSPRNGQFCKQIRLVSHVVNTTGQITAQNGPFEELTLFVSHVVNTSSPASHVVNTSSPASPRNVPFGREVRLGWYVRENRVPSFRVDPV